MPGNNNIVAKRGNVSEEMIRQIKLIDFVFINIIEHGDEATFFYFFLEMTHTTYVHWVSKWFEHFFFNMVPNAADGPIK